MSVAMPVVVPLTMTATPAIGSPVSSVTLPVMVRACAEASIAQSAQTTRSRIRVRDFDPPRFANKC